MTSSDVAGGAGHLGAKLRALRKQKRLTLDALAAKASLSKSYLWELENHHSKRLSAEKLSAIADALGVDAAYFLEDDNREPDEKHVDAAFYRAYLKLDPVAKDQMRRILTTFQHRNHTT